MSVPTLGGTSLPMPSGYSRTYEQRGGMRKMASGRVVEDNLSVTAKHEFTLDWKLLTQGQVTTIEGCWAALVGTSATYVDIDSASYTVTKHESALRLEWKAVKASAGLRYDGSIKLREV